MSEQHQPTVAPTKRKPGRPRRSPVQALQPAPPAPPAPVDDDVRVVGLREAAQILGKSPSTIKRLIKSDPDFPRPFSILGAPNNFISRDIRRYVLRKAGHPVDAE